MGTKIEYSINLLATSVDSKNFTNDAGGDVWEHFQNKSLTNNNNKHFNKIGDNKLQDSMDMIPDRNNIESIKRTMQMHEDIFKNQVRELHRVYSVQKMMMDELKNEIRQKKLWKNFQQSSVHNNVQPLREDLCSKERSGSCSASGDTMRKQKGFDLERPLAEEVAVFATADEAEAAAEAGTRNNDDEEMEVDLTLSIGGSHHINKNNYDTDNNNNNNSKNKKKGHCMVPLGFSDSSRNNYGKIKELMNSSVSFQSDRDCSDPTTPMSSSSVTYDQERERKGPHWLSQGLKLN
ncbi:uncharacterized protein LOC130973239 [Arachis stenosperma]|uniref:uncharacterized protein LOC130973239 n=1 Tax=Arachis stenosperma TaxID=217475 RepID=UPI0025AD327D|nr:uncharacterized protein LOC130973239 [Arachis stenosperma]